MTTMRFHEEGVKLRTREMELLYQLELPMTHYMPALRAARLKNIEGVERWSEGIAKDLKRKKVIPEDIAGLPPPAAARVEEMPLPSLINRGKCLKRELRRLLHSVEECAVKGWDLVYFLAFTCTCTSQCSVLWIF